LILLVQPEVLKTKGAFRGFGFHLMVTSFASEVKALFLKMS